MWGAWRGVCADPPHSSADPRHSSSLLVLEPLTRGRGPDRSICDLGERRVAERPAGLAGTGGLELLRSGEGVGRKGERGRSDGVSEEMKVVYARSGCLDRLE